MTFNVEIVLKGRDFAVTETLQISHGEPSSWNDEAVRDALIEILRAMDRAGNPQADAERQVVLRGFSWIVEPSGKDVVLAIEIPMGAAVAGPFAIGQREFDAMISRVLRVAAPKTGSTTVH
jgi:hypothetical protein